MNAAAARIGEDDLHAFLDGELSPERQAEVTAWLAANPDEAERLAAYRQQIADLHESYDAVAAEPLPPRLVAATQGRAMSGRKLLSAAAALVLLAAGFAGGWWSKDWLLDTSRQGVALAARGVSAHRVFTVEVRHPVEVAADQEAHLVKWLTKRLGARVRAPDLSAMGYRLVGGRLLAEAGTPAAQLMYESADGGRMTIYLRGNNSGEETAFRFVAAGDISAFYWLEESLAYAIVAELPRTELLTVAHEIYRQLEP
ncbi:MAG: anti-sigma factor [Alphaproteobacteria bacterium]|jgi:anti-sigma factor RsiW|nr:anti-sigma factor [Alphaproteobacteria bacterium]MDP6563425.1 anti-sigma factor [Alphaproteobacteria bacterium]MDP6815276.1 anti-sigma factor [Alphaproteobacteria bacterium]